MHKSLDEMHPVSQGTVHKLIKWSAHMPGNSLLMRMKSAVVPT